MRAVDAIKNYLDNIKNNVENQVGDHDKDIIYTDIDFIKWLIGELNGDLNADINIYQMFDIYINELDYKNL